MMTLRRFAHQLDSIPATTAWYLADIGEARGTQERTPQYTQGKV